MNISWCEVWINDSNHLPYVLLLCVDEDNPSEFLIIDPQDNRKVIMKTTDYEEAEMWLSADEFIFVDGRVEI
ncbi:MAG: hypothetical protein B0A82_25600 [Alkalinema sp. CACIAM 70d]|nr:MAG: hypothetical protein B0A82_25600 [Alkalinema sp. CACIAM 70d]